MYKEINPSQLDKTPFEMIGKDWMLITAGDSEKYNTMTASWGGMGFLWNKNVLFAFVRPQRYTYGFLNDNDYFTCSFYDEQYRGALSFCGKYSGRDFDKAKETGLVPCFEQEAPYFEQANTVIVCRKLYVQPMAPDFLTEPDIGKNYSSPDEYHTLFIAEIVKVLKK